MNGFRKYLGMALLICLSPHAQAESPSEFITEAVEVLASQLDGRRSELADDQDALYALIDDLLLPRFDRKTAAQQVLARHWRGANDEQKTRFIESFYTILVQRYADGVLEFEPDRIKVLPFRGDATKRTATVKTSVDLEDGTNISVNYTLMNKNPGWMMFDVTIEGVPIFAIFVPSLTPRLRPAASKK